MYDSFGECAAHPDKVYASPLEGIRLVYTPRDTYDTEFNDHLATVERHWSGLIAYSGLPATGSLLIVETFTYEFIPTLANRIIFNGKYEPTDVQ